jgi:predicted lipoprotein with Yx(FWY)xxD motif
MLFARVRWLARSSRCGSAPPAARWSGVARLALAGIVAVAVLAAGCQGSPPPAHIRGKSAGWIPKAPPAFTPTTGPSVVRVVTIRGGRFLTDARGMTIYLNNGPAKVPWCTGSCTYVWHPVLVTLGHVVDSGNLGVRLGILDRPGGLHQVSVNGHRAYTFSGDTKPGQFHGASFITGRGPGRLYTWRPVPVTDNAPTAIVLKAK